MIGLKTVLSSFERGCAQWVRVTFCPLLWDCWAAGAVVGAAACVGAAAWVGAAAEVGALAEVGAAGAVVGEAGDAEPHAWRIAATAKPDAVVSPKRRKCRREVEPE